MSQFDDLMAQVDRASESLTHGLRNVQRIAETRAEMRRVHALASVSRVELDAIMERCETLLQEMKA